MWILVKESDVSLFLRVWLSQVVCSAHKLCTIDRLFVRRGCSSVVERSLCM